MDLRRVVGGLLTRNAAVSTLLLNYADRLATVCPGHGTGAAPWFVVPTWGIDGLPRWQPGHQVLTVEAHAPGTDLRDPGDLDSILGLVHVVLTDDHARSSVTARRLGTPAAPAISDLGTVVRTASWDTALVPSSDPGVVQRRLLPWPDCRSAVLTTGTSTPRTASMN